MQSGNATISRMRALSGQVTSRLKRALHLGVQKTLEVVMMHYQIDLEEVSSTGYVIAEHLTDDEALVAIGEADAAVDGAAMSSLFEGDLFPGDDEDEDGTNDKE